jgi:hypothetical protein
LSSYFQRFFFFWINYFNVIKYVRRDTTLIHKEYTREPLIWRKRTKIQKIFKTRNKQTMMHLIFKEIDITYLKWQMITSAHTIKGKRNLAKEDNHYSKIISFTYLSFLFFYDGESCTYLLFHISTLLQNYTKKSNHSQLKDTLFNIPFNEPSGISYPIC